MRKDDLLRIKARAGLIHMFVTIAFLIGAVVLIAGLLGLLFLIFASPERFAAVKGTIDWSLTFAVNESSNFYMSVPFKIIQPLDSSMFSAKYALIAYLFSFLLSFGLILYGIRQVENIATSIMSNDETPFDMNNAKSLKRLAYSIIIYTLASDMLATLLCALVTKIFAFNVSFDFLPGVIIGLIVLLIADIFRYGVFLQNEFDTTL
ncbi:DUF2975 domain-containing protein [Desulfitobacterium sp. THU1]|uniref:DUF2975 domain-containing protein n=1 Tax=Desulfitobacterium sp. THU1 TaxID=3138072 RepID=UPI0031201A08